MIIIYTGTHYRQEHEAEKKRVAELKQAEKIKARLREEKRAVDTANRAAAMMDNMQERAKLKARVAGDVVIANGGLEASGEGYSDIDALNEEDWGSMAAAAMAFGECGEQHGVYGPQEGSGEESDDPSSSFSHVRSNARESASVAGRAASAADAGADEAVVLGANEAANEAAMGGDASAANENGGGKGDEAGDSEGRRTSDADGTGLHKELKESPVYLATLRVYRKFNTWWMQPLGGVWSKFLPIRALHCVVSSPAFESLIFLLILLNTVTMAMDTYPEVRNMLYIFMLLYRMTEARTYFLNDML